MKPSIQTLGQILYSPSQYVIPVFQRNYRWERPQWDKLWTSLLEIQSPQKRGNHFMGFLVFVPGLAQPGQHTTFHLIDGQQRLTTSTIILAAIRNVARQSSQAELADEIHQYYLVHPLKKGDQHFRLLPKERDYRSYIALISGIGEASGRVADALDFFEEQIAAWAASEPTRLRALFDTACQRLEFMCATLEAENAYNIFKSLNSTGVPLGASDLIRNFVFMHVPPDDQDEFDDTLWSPLESAFSREDGSLDEERFSRFFRDFLMSAGRYVPPKETFAAFEARYEATGFSPTALTRVLIANVERYDVISGRTEDKDPAVTKALKGLNQLESSTTYPVLLALFERRARESITNEQLAKGIEMLRGFILRRFVCGESSRGYGQMFVRALGKEAGSPIESLEAYLLERGWPDDRQFRSAFVEFPLYQRGYTKEVLEALERARGHKEPADLQEAQVEHVLPQTLNKEWIDNLGADSKRIWGDWLHRPGNLTLSGYNRELWNHPFALKRKRYAESNIVITREIGESSRWGEAEIRERGVQLAAAAAAIWMGPKEQISRPKLPEGDEEGSDSRFEVRTRFWTGLGELLAAEHPDLPGFDPRPSWTLRLPSGLRHIGIELRFSLRQRAVGIDLWFWRAASLPVWTQIRSEPGPFNDLVGASWEFEQIDGQDRARMFLNHAMDPKNEAAWPDLYRWMADKLSLVYAEVAPRLRERMELLASRGESFTEDGREAAISSDGLRVADVERP